MTKHHEISMAFAMGFAAGGILYQFPDPEGRFEALMLVSSIATILIYVLYHETRYYR